MGMNRRETTSCNYVLLSKDTSVSDTEQLINNSDLDIRQRGRSKSALRIYYYKSKIIAYRWFNISE
jgi:hypothetical protein